MVKNIVERIQKNPLCIIAIICDPHVCKADFFLNYFTLPVPDASHSNIYIISGFLYMATLGTKIWCLSLLWFVPNWVLLVSLRSYKLFFDDGPCFTTNTGSLLPWHFMAVFHIYILLFARGSKLHSKKNWVSGRTWIVQVNVI